MERERGRCKEWEKVRGKERGRNEEKFNNLLSRSVPEAAKPFLGHMRYSFIHCVAVCVYMCVCQCTSVWVCVCSSMCCTCVYVWVGVLTISNR